MKRPALVALGGSSRSEWLLVVGRRLALPVALLLTLAVLGVDLLDADGANAPLFLLVVPVALCAAVYGFKGASPPA